MEAAMTVVNGSAVTKVAAVSDETMSALVLHGDLSKLAGPQKVEYYRAFCARVGLDPATQPFKLLKLNGKEILYCDRGGTAQLNKQHKVSHTITERRKDEDIYSVIARASTPDGRQTESIGAVAIGSLKGEALANAMMKAETKSKRRATLDLLGLGMLDESEVDSIPNATPATVVDTQPLQLRETAPAAMTDGDREVHKAWKVWRAKANKTFQGCRTAAELEAAKAKFETIHQGAKIWAQFTHHNEFETFGTLLDQHLERARRDDELASPEGIARWVKAVEASDLKGLTQRVSEYHNQERLQNEDCLGAIHERARQLGMDSIDDLMEPDRDDSELAQGQDQ